MSTDGERGSGERLDIYELARKLSVELNDMYIGCIRREWGNTNAAVLTHWRDKLRAALQSRVLPQEPDSGAQGQPASGATPPVECACRKALEELREAVADLGISYNEAAEPLLAGAVEACEKANAALSTPCSPCPTCAEERERADSNYTSCERIKRKLEEATAERDSLREQVRDRIQQLLEVNNADLERRREAERQAQVWERVAKLLMDGSETIEAFLVRQWEWSRRTFGDEYRREQLVAHIRKELLEIEADPSDRIEWIDIVLLALDGYNRCAGGTVGTLMADLQAKQAKNFARKWVQAGPGEPVEHEREEKPHGPDERN